MTLKLIRETSIPDVIKRRPIANPELFVMMQEFDESDMDVASIDIGDAEQATKTVDQAYRYCNRFFNGRIKVLKRGKKIYLVKN